MLPDTIERPAFGGHETFPFRYSWLPKAVQFVSDDPSFFLRPDAMVRLGVGKNMVRSIRHWGLGVGILEEDPSSPRGQALRVTPLGARIFQDGGWDQFLEDPATAWLLHWEIAKNPRRSTAWYWFFSHLPQPEFSRTDLVSWLRKLAQENGWTKASEATIRGDVDCIIRSYVSVAPSKRFSADEALDSPLAELALVREFGSRNTFLLVRREQTSLPDEVFAYAFIDYVGGRKVETKTLPLNAIAFGPGSPGRVFCLDEDAVRARLERLEHVTDGAFSFDETAGLRQVLIRELPIGSSLLDRYYMRHGPVRMGREA